MHIQTPVGEPDGSPLRTRAGTRSYGQAGWPAWQMARSWLPCTHREATSHDASLAPPQTVLVSRRNQQCAHAPRLALARTFKDSAAGEQPHDSHHTFTPGVYLRPPDQPHLLAHQRAFFTPVQSHKQAS
jgi:hypothetical protein